MQKSITTLFMGLAMLILIQSIAGASDEIQQIKQSIAKKGANWSAGESWVTKLSPEERKKLCGASLEAPDPSLGKMIVLPMIEDLPEQLDWRDNNGNWVTPVKHQSSPQGCGSCWDFAATAAVESWWKIHNNQPDSMIDLSEQFILSCGEAGSCSGGSPSAALEFVRTTGVPSEACFEYQADDQIPCSDACAEWQNEAVKIPAWGWITYEEDITGIIKNAVYRHPVSTRYDVYTDFLYYTGGVYEHTWGELEGGHAVLIVGWNDAEQSWICKNSWNTDWGEDGYFRIKWGNCEIGEYAPFIWDGIIGEQAFSVSPQQIDLTLTIGDSLSQNLTVSNLGPDILDYSSWDYELPYAAYFHPDSFNSWNGVSWWCADTQLAGYGDNWQQYLDLPALDLSGISNPKLSWMGYWAMEEPPETITMSYDGWDGCNVWISVDSGITFSIINPTSPEYNCQNLFGFDDLYAGHFHKPDFPGWGGSSAGWVPVDFNLSAYKSDNVIIRFAFASDMDYCTLDDSQLYGLFVDDVIVSDGGNILFENYGESGSAMQISGNTGRKQADWLDISGGFGTVQPYDSVLLNFTISTRNLDPGRHDGIISFSSNDTTNSSIVPSGKVHLNLNILLPDYDLAVRNIGSSTRSIPISLQNEMKAEITNCGLYDVVSFEAVCMVFDGEEIVYCEAVHIPLLEAGTSKIVDFEPFITQHSEKQLKCKTTLLNIASDYNTYNNTTEYALNTTNFISGFEQDSALWTFEDGWGFTTDAHWTGKRSSHINSGVTPYLNNMDAIMILNPALSLVFLDNALIKYYTAFLTEQDKDVCYVEISGDSITWTKIDTLTGTSYNSNWEQREVEFASLIEEGFTKGWLRFHFISDSVNTDIGVYIDQLEVYPTVTAISEEGIANRIPETWKLYQNYPNPFNPKTVISYQLPISSSVELSIYNILGQKVAALVNKKQPAGVYTIEWDASGFASGVYIYKLETDNGFVQSRKLIVLR